MTSATLSANGSFDHVTGRTGFGDCEELLLGSPFDYERAAMICVPSDMAEPTSWAYPEAVNQAVMESAMVAGGHTMALFTSHAALRASASALRGHLQANGIAVLAQGVDGTPAQLLRRFREEPKSVLLGTASFWGGCRPARGLPEGAPGIPAPLQCAVGAGLRLPLRAVRRPVRRVRGAPGDTEAAAGRRQAHTDQDGQGGRGAAGPPDRVAAVRKGVFGLAAARNPQAPQAPGAVLRDTRLAGMSSRC